LLLALLLAISTPLLQIHLEGEFLDPPDVLERVVRGEVGGEYLGEPAAADGPRGTQGRLADTLRSLGYESAFAAHAGPGGVELTIILHPIRRIRQVYVRPLFGKFPLFDEDITRRIRFRPGQPLPPPADLERAFEEEKSRVRLFLERSGYFDGQVEFFVRPRSRPEEVDLDVVLYKGTGYNLDESQPLVWFDATADRLALSPAEVRSFFHHDHWWERLRCFWLCGEFSSEHLRDDMTALLHRYHERGFPGARVANDFSPERGLDRAAKRARFTVSISTRKKVEVAFRGNHHISDDDLGKALTFDEAGSYDTLECEQSARSLHQQYQRQGFYEAEVTFRREEPTPNLVRITFDIEEGPELKVRRIEFVGNATQPAATLHGVIETREFPAIGVIGLGEGGYVTNTQLAQDEERIADFYRRRGYPQVRVSGEVATDPALLGTAGAQAAALALGNERRDEDLFVRFTIDEGPRLQVAGVAVTYAGEHRTTIAEAMRYIRLRPGQPLEEDAVKADRDALRHWLRNSGFANAEVKSLEGGPEGDPNRTVVFEVSEGRFVRFGEKLVRGNFLTRPHVVLRELPWHAGDPFDESKVEAAERNLRIGGLFTTIRMSYLAASAEPDVVHTVVQVEERYDGIDFEFAGGWASDARGYVTAKAAYRNLFGFGKAVELSGTYGERRQELSGTYIDPHLGGSRFRLDTTLFIRVEQTVRLGDIRTSGFSTTFSREVAPRLRLFVRYDFKKINRNETLQRPSGPSEDKTSIEVPTLDAMIGPGFDLDRSDNPLAPTRGYRLSGQLAWAGPYFEPFGESPSFLKLNVIGTAYVPLGRGVLVYGGLRYDQGWPLAGASLLPKVERFFAGGDTSVRGFEDDRLKTEVVRVPVPPLPGAPGFQIIPLGGNIRILSKLELIFPILRSKIPLQAALFFDTGLVTNSFDGLSLSDFRHSVGIAPVRLNTPVGFLSLEYAWPLDPQFGDDPSGRFHFNFGFGF
jgi:outer membrane protein insertion porin family